MGYTGKQTQTNTEPALADEDWSARARPLRECGDIAATRLAIALSDALKQAGDQLFAKGAGGPASHEQRAWLDAADFIRARRQDMVDAFRKHFQHRYDLACRHKSSALSGRVVDFDFSQLRIVEHDRLDDSLDPGDITEAIRNGTWSSLHELTSWFRALLGDPDLAPIDSPLGPRLVGAAITDAVNGQYWGPDSKQRALRALGRTLPELVNRVYRDINAHHAVVDVSESFEIPVDAFCEPSPGPDSQAPSAQDATADEAPGANMDAEAEAAALATAGVVVASQIAAIRLPRFIIDFLSGPWQTLLVRLYREQGASGPRWEEALGTMDDLVWSLRAKPTEDRSRLMRSLPDLVKRLRQGLDLLGEPADRHAEFFARLAECHIRVLASAPAEPEVAARQAPAPAPLEQAALDKLETGAWLAMADEDGASRELKLAWISPHRKLFLLTNHQGERALSLNAKDLATRLRDGLAHVIPAPGTARQGESEALPPENKKTV